MVAHDADLLYNASNQDAPHDPVEAFSERRKGQTSKHAYDVSHGNHGQRLVGPNSHHDSFSGQDGSVHHVNQGRDQRGHLHGIPDLRKRREQGNQHRQQEDLPDSQSQTHQCRPAQHAIGGLPCVLVALRGIGHVPGAPKGRHQRGGGTLHAHQCNDSDRINLHGDAVGGAAHPGDIQNLRPPCGHQEAHVEGQLPHEHGGASRQQGHQRFHRGWLEQHAHLGQLAAQEQPNVGQPTQGFRGRRGHGGTNKTHPRK
mmetsp:Transcript_5745/g.16403  ORF Transcript_5745/g.16403 Transcript_5745/m.16403 type:complete len:256 (+) Transcript_5745:2127-2894(+)